MTFIEKHKEIVQSNIAKIESVIESLKMLSDEGKISEKTSETLISKLNNVQKGVFWDVVSRFQKENHNGFSETMPLRFAEGHFLLTITLKPTNEKKT